MASNDQWPPVASASTGKGSTKINVNKRNIKESQQETLATLNEMFGSTLEPAVILSIVQNCNWELQPSIEGLITLSETVEDPLTWYNSDSTSENIASIASEDSDEIRKISTGNIMEKEYVPYTPENSPNVHVSNDPVLPFKTDKPKKGGAKNRMGSFCGNIAKLKSSGEKTSNLSRDKDRLSVKIEHKHDVSNVTEADSCFEHLCLYGATGSSNISTVVNPIDLGYGNFPDSPRSRSSSCRNKVTNSPGEERKIKNSPKKRGNKSAKEKRDNRDPTMTPEEITDYRDKNQKVVSFDSKMNIRKNESESLCGLKVQYRLSGMESSSDDDADVVIEDESSDYTISHSFAAAANVSQFLSSPTETPPRRTQPEIHMINTPSPPQTPRHSVHDATLTRIKGSIMNGNKILILLRGLPGSGKTTLAKSIVDTTTGGNSSLHIFSTDDFFITLGRGVYQFDPTRLQDAHSTNHQRVKNAMKDGRSPIIVDNTNIEAREMRPYASMAVQNGYILEIIEPNTPWARNPKELAEKNTHNVPKSKIRERASRYEGPMSGKRLLDMYGLKYSSANKPPQIRLVPPFMLIERFVPCMADIKSNWDNDQKNNYVLTTHDIESMQNIDESHNSIPNNEYQIVNDDSSNSSITNNPDNLSNYTDGLFNDYLQELQDSDDESFEMLEGSGSEHPSDLGKSLDFDGSTDSQRSVDITKNDNDESLEDLCNDDSSPNSSQQPLGAIGSERKGRNDIDESHEDFCNKDSSPNDSQQTLGVIGSERKGRNDNDESREDLCNNDSSPNGSQQTLGAIGSERKGSLAVVNNVANHDSEIKSSDNNDNVLSQCWDFTMIRGTYTLHSRHGEYVSPFQISTKDSTKMNDENVTVEKFVSEEGEDCENTGKSVIFQSQLINMEKLMREVPADSVIDDIIAIDVTEKENLVKKILDSDDKLEIDRTLLEEENIVIEDIKRKITRYESSPRYFIDKITEKTSKFDTEIKEEIAKGSNDNDEEGTTKTTTFGSILNLIKTSILGGNEETTTTINEKIENTEGPDKFEARENRDCKAEDLINENEEVLINLDTVDLSQMYELDETTEKTSSATDNDEIHEKTDSREDLLTNPFKEEMIRSCSDNKIGNVINPLTDNINSISWKESPFPLDDTIIPILSSFDDKKIVPMSDAQTMTTNYDFNVAYVGGTSEPEYHELWGVNRCINEGSTNFSNVERQPLKIMFDKSSMTGESNILANETNLNDEKEKDTTDRLDDLIEMFPHYPDEYLKTLYEQQCNRNFDWVVDVLLLADVPNVTIENYEKKRTRVVDDDRAFDAMKLSKVDSEKLKERSHSSSPNNRRNRAKKFRSFSLEYADDRDSTSTETSFNADERNVCKNGNDDYDDKILKLLYAKALSDNNLPVVRNDMPDVSSAAFAPNNEIIDNEDDSEELMELNFGREFINQMESACGNADFVLPDEFEPVIRMKKSMLDELYGLWIQSMDRQMSALHAQLDDRMAKDEAMARAVDREEMVKIAREPVVPNLEEIINMEMAMARYQNELKKTVTKETPDDMASRLTRQMLYELVPDIDQQTLSDILKAHDGNFKETCEIIEANIGRTISKYDTLRKQQSLLERANEERKNRDIQQNLENTSIPVIAVNPDVHAIGKSEKLHCQDAVARGINARMEAQKQFSLRIENYNKAAEAYRKGNPEVAAYYSQMVKLHTENIKAAHAEAASKFLSAQMYTKDGEVTLDLHNLFVREALQAVDIFLDFQLKKLNKSNKRSTCLSIITGYGARSNNGLGRIKPAVLKKLISRNIRFTETNPGCLKVTLSRRNGMLD